MTASEWLRELERRGAEGKWKIYEETHHEPTDDPKYTDRWILDNGVILNWGDGDIPLGPAELIVTLRNVLPLIADVIEAAERVSMMGQVDLNVEEPREMLRGPLAALRDSLEEK